MLGRIYLEIVWISPKKLRRRFLCTEHSKRLYEQLTDALRIVILRPKFGRSCCIMPKATLKRWFKREYKSERWKRNANS